MTLQTKPETVEAGLLPAEKLARAADCSGKMAGKNDISLRADCPGAGKAGTGARAQQHSWGERHWATRPRRQRGGLAQLLEGERSSAPAQVAQRAPARALAHRPVVRRAHQRPCQHWHGHQMTHQPGHQQGQHRQRGGVSGRLRFGWSQSCQSDDGRPPGRSAAAAGGSAGWRVTRQLPRVVLKELALSERRTPVWLRMPHGERPWDSCERECHEEPPEPDSGGPAPGLEAPAPAPPGRPVASVPPSDGGAGAPGLEPRREPGDEAMIARARVEGEEVGEGEGVEVGDEDSWDNGEEKKLKRKAAPKKVHCRPATAVVRHTAVPERGNGEAEP